MNMVYQDLVKMQVQMQQNIVQAGERKYEYDSDEDTEESLEFPVLTNEASAPYGN